MKLLALCVAFVTRPIAVRSNRSNGGDGEYHEFADHERNRILIDEVHETDFGCRLGSRETVAANAPHVSKRQYSIGCGSDAKRNANDDQQ